MRLTGLISAEAWMNLWSMKRYLFNTLAMVVVMYVIFLGLFTGLRTFAGERAGGESLDAMVVGYVLWMSAMFALQGTSGIVLQESQQGTLEQLYLSPMGTERIFLAKAIIGTVFNFLILTLMLYLVMLTTGRWHSVNLPLFYGMLLLSLLSLQGIGFMLGGIGLIHKRIGAVNSILSFGLIGLMMLPVYPFTPWALLPFIAGAHTINSQIVTDAAFPAWWYLFIAGNSFFYLLAGIAFFRIFERRARKLGKLGQY